MKKMTLLCVLLLSLSVSALSAQDKLGEAENKIKNLEKPLYNPFVEYYIMQELRDLREANRQLKVEMHELLTQKELAAADRAVSYTTSTINNMFYIIAAASTLLLLVGWSSFKDINERIRVTVSEKVAKVLQENESRMEHFERNLEARSIQVLKNQEEIAKTNTIQSLWMRAGLESTPNGKIEIYDQILSIRPQEAEAISYKADAALELGEVHWSLSLSNQSLSIDPDYPNAYYHRACAYCQLGYYDNCMDDLEKALEFNENYMDEILNEDDFTPLEGNGRFSELIEKYHPKSS